MKVPSRKDLNTLHLPNVCTANHLELTKPPCDHDKIEFELET